MALPILAQAGVAVQPGRVTPPSEPPTADPGWESVNVSGSSMEAVDDDDDGGQAGAREPLSPRNDPPELAAEAER